MQNELGKDRSLLVALLAGLMLGLSYPPVPFGGLAFIAFVGIFWLYRRVESYAKAIRMGYLIFLIVNLLTLYWTGGFTHGHDRYMLVAGTLLLLAHPFFFCVPLAAFLFIRKNINYWVALLIFPVLWTAFEYLHSATQISFPWLTLGNTQTYHLRGIQFISFTGIYGVTFWILVVNVVIYILVERFFLSPSVRRTGIVIIIFLVFGVGYFLPEFLSGDRPRGNLSHPLHIGVIQPNIDPFEKWEDNPDHSVSVLASLTRDLSPHTADIVIWPETAVPFYILDPANRESYNALKHFEDSINVPLLTGIPDIVYYRSGDSIPKSSKKTRSGQSYDTYNSSMLLLPRSDSLQKYAKIQLVPFAERVPFSEQLSFLNAMQWNFGLGGWGIGRDTTVFILPLRDSSTARFSTLICYESIYPGFVASFVRRGAEFITVITNDSWWGNTSGAYQHEQYSMLRAIENRRWVIQCANGGISCVIDPEGRIVTATRMYTQAAFLQGIKATDGMTFYSVHGDWLAEICAVISGFVIMSAIGKKIYQNIRRRQTNEIH